MRIRYVTRSNSIGSSAPRKTATTNSLRSLYRRVPSHAATQGSAPGSVAGDGTSRSGVARRSKALRDSLASRYSHHLRSDVGRLSRDSGDRLRSPKKTSPRTSLQTSLQTGLRTRSQAVQPVATSRVAGDRFGLSSTIRRSTGTLEPGRTVKRRGSRTWRSGHDWGWGFRHYQGTRRHHRHRHHHHHYWLGLGLWCGFGYWGSYYADYWYHHYRYHPYRFLYWWCPDYYYYQVPVFVYPLDSVAVYGDTVVEPADTADTKEEAPTVESIIANHVKLGDFYFREGKYDKAAESYLRALAYAPEDASIHFILADALFGMGDYHYAAFIISKALRLDPEMAKAAADKRDFYRDPKEFAKQLETLRKYINKKPYDSAAHLVMGYNLYFSGEPALAKKAFERVLEVSPDNQAARLFLEAMDTPDPEPGAHKSDRATSKPAETPSNKG